MATSSTTMLSEQMLGRARPKPMYEDEEGVLSILDAATNDLALLINNLDLQATPGTPDLMPLRPSPLSTVEKDASDSASLSLPGSTESNDSPAPKSSRRCATVADSPLKCTLHGSMASFSSLMPYAQSRGRPKSEQDMANAANYGDWRSVRVYKPSQRTLNANRVLTTYHHHCTNTVFHSILILPAG
ncbi:unnamed protein product [Cyclocybe aegerita]|uniref:Uncharacterized protein n=1 Tax=Cyclocybe aegerita TaxID=1973307 RepID=A0A8S0WRN7_CYCAE|nr:unnamed protein product [Cyclocybe aegerita]